jgi:hypothetical protein
MSSWAIAAIGLTAPNAVMATIRIDSLVDIIVVFPGKLSFIRASQLTSPKFGKNLITYIVSDN